MPGGDAPLIPAEIPHPARIWTYGTTNVARPGKPSGDPVGCCPAAAAASGGETGADTTIEPGESRAGQPPCHRAVRLLLSIGGSGAAVGMSRFSSRESPTRSEFFANRPALSLEWDTIDSTGSRL